MTIFLINCYHKENVQLQQMNYDYYSIQILRHFSYTKKQSTMMSASVVVRGSHYWYEAPVSVVYTITGGEAPL